MINLSKFLPFFIPNVHRACSFFTNLDLFCIDNARVIYTKYGNLIVSFFTNLIYKFFILNHLLHSSVGPGSSVGIATDYGLDGPESNPGRDEIFHPSRPALGPTQPTVNGYRIFPGGKVWPGRPADHSPPSSAVVTEE